VGSIIITVDDIPDSQLVYNEEETRQILKFFWPDLEVTIDNMTIDNDARRLAQVAMIAAIDGTYAYGYIAGLFHTLSRRNLNLRQLGRRLARNFVRHWWEHATQRDLEDVQIYDYVRIQVGSSLRSRIDGMRNGASLRRGNTTVAFA
jgi:hypothetical protein